MHANVEVIVRKSAGMKSCHAMSKNATAVLSSNNKTDSAGNSPGSDGMFKDAAVFNKEDLLLRTKLHVGKTPGSSDAIVLSTKRSTCVHAGHDHTFICFVV